MKKSHFYLFIVCVGLLSCSKDDPQPSRLELLLANVWQLEGFRYGNDFEDAEPCFQGNTLTFYEDGTFQSLDLEPFCKGDEDVEGTWSLSEDGEELTMIAQAGAGVEINVYPIVKLTSSAFEYSASSDEVIVYSSVD